MQRFYLHVLLSLGFLVLTGSVAPCQSSTGQSSTGQSYEERLAWSNSHGQRTRGGVYRDSFELNFFGEDERFAWYVVRTGADSRELVLVDTQTGSRAPAVDPEIFSAELTSASGKPCDARDFEIDSIEFSEDASMLRFRFHGKRWSWERATEQLSEERVDGEAGAQVRGLRPLDFVPRSAAGDSTTIEIFNKTGKTLSVFWVDTQGGRIPYGQINPGDSFSQNTYVSHTWLLLDQEGNPVAAFQAGAGDKTAYVEPATPAPNKERSADRSGRRRWGSNSGRDAARSPDGNWSVELREHNVVLINQDSKQEWSLTEDGAEQNGFSGRIYWSPNSQHFVVLKTERAEQRQVKMIDSAPDDQLQPKELQISYTKPGDELDHPRPFLFHIPPATATASDSEEPIAIAVDDNLFPNPYAIDRFSWTEDSSEFTFVYNQRGHQVLRVIAIAAETGIARAMVDETSDTFVCYSQKFFYQPLEQTGEVLWMTERDGWNHIIMIDWTSGEVKHRVTSGEWVVREVERVDTESRTLWLKISGYHKDQDPYYLHFARVNFDGSNFQVLSGGDGNHDWNFSPDENWLIDTYSRVDMPPVTTLRSVETGELICELERADYGELRESGWLPPERFVAKGRDGETDIHGIIVRPTNFDPTKIYPVLEAIYAGPHSSFTPKSFGRQRGLYEMADMGFIVVKLDGMGTSDRSKKFHDVCWKNLGDSGFPDRILWMQAAAKKYSELDITRVGIWGGSAGGQSALRALLAFGDFYDAAAADCGCHDNRMDKIWWNEQWMGWPIGDHYEEQSNVTQAGRLLGKLLLTVGELDTNVDPASTMQVVDALIKADKDFELIVFPGAGHGIGSGRYGTRRMKEFFARSLGGPESKVAN